MNTDNISSKNGPWNPGIKSQLPREHLPLSTMFSRENVSTSIERAHELSDFCGVAAHDLVAFRAERLIMHELLVRVTADIAVDDGPKYEDLGISFRRMASVILDTYIAPHRRDLVRLHDELRDKAAAMIAGELAKELFPGGERQQSKAESRPWRWFPGFGKAKAKAPPETAEQRRQRIFAEWRRKSAAAASPFEKSCYQSLIKVVMAITGKRGRLIGDSQLITDLAATFVCNDHGSTILGAAIDGYIREAVAREGYRLLPPQAKPVVMNVKGASAAGKSTLRPRQRALAKKLNVPWDDFALISPDIWRKFLLDYDKLGPAGKYAGMLSGQEVEVIDKKLDRYMAAKAADGRMSHLLIDRFRFDSFAAESDDQEASTLLTRFGDLIYMFFVITPPEDTVERAWRRGLEFGRYKAVDDLLHHNVEAFTGMPQLFFTWALRTKKRVHYEFLDNSVAKGSQPRTIAFGWNGEMTILDIKFLLDVDRFRKININARGPEEVYAGKKMAAEQNVEFLKQCAKVIEVINFADYHTGRVYARLERGKWAWRDQRRFAEMLQDADAGAGLRAIGSGDDDGGAADFVPPNLQKEKDHTLGAWGGHFTGLISQARPS